MHNTDEMQRRICQQLAAIPYGKVASYGQIARLCGLPGYARYVGRYLKHLPTNSQLPWHRVVNAQGRIALPVDSAAYQQQLQRLRFEGVELQGGKVSMARHGWQPD